MDHANDGPILIHVTVVGSISTQCGGQSTTLNSNSFCKVTSSIPVTRLSEFKHLSLKVRRATNSLKSVLLDQDILAPLPCQQHLQPKDSQIFHITLIIQNSNYESSVSSHKDSLILNFPLAFLKN